MKDRGEICLLALVSPDGIRGGIMHYHTAGRGTCLPDGRFKSFASPRMDDHFHFSLAG